MSSRSRSGDTSKKIMRALRLPLELFAALVLRASAYLPGRAVDSLAATLGGLFWHLAGRRRAVALSNLRRAYAGEKSEGELAYIGRESFTFIPLMALGLVWELHRWRADAPPVRIEGIERLKSATADGRGAILVMPHLGIFPLASAALAERGFHVAYISRRMSSKPLTDLLWGLARERAVEMIPAHPRELCLNESLKHLRSGGVLIILGDQRSATSTVEVPFFGVPTATALGPAVLAARSRAAMLPASCARLGRGEHLLHVGEPIPGGKNFEERAAAMNKSFERWIRRYPEQWLWLHKRWR